MVTVPNDRCGGLEEHLRSLPGPHFEVVQSTSDAGLPVESVPRQRPTTGTPGTSGMPSSCTGYSMSASCLGNTPCEVQRRALPCIVLMHSHALSRSWLPREGSVQLQYLGEWEQPLSISQQSCVAVTTLLER